MLTVVNLDPSRAQEATLQLDLADLGLPDDRHFLVIGRVVGRALLLGGLGAVRPAGPRLSRRPCAGSASFVVISPFATPEPRWFQRAVFYEILVRGFFDSNDDGTGDLAGITAKLDYLQWLGVDCLWLLPFYQSPLRDGGYDISDFWTILPEYGDLADAVELVEEAHKRGLRVIADLVMNHTSDQHPWFRRIPPGPHQPQG